MEIGLKRVIAIFKWVTSSSYRLKPSLFVASVTEFFVMEKLFFSHPVFFRWCHKSLPEGKWTWNFKSHDATIAEKVELGIFGDCKYTLEKRSSKQLYRGLKSLYETKKFFVHFFNYKRGKILLQKCWIGVFESAIMK